MRTLVRKLVALLCRKPVEKPAVPEAAPQVLPKIKVVSFLQFAVDDIYWKVYEQYHQHHSGVKFFHVCFGPPTVNWDALVRECENADLLVTDYCVPCEFRNEDGRRLDFDARPSSWGNPIVDLIFRTRQKNPNVVVFCMTDDKGEREYPPQQLGNVRLFENPREEVISLVIREVAANKK